MRREIKITGDGSATLFVPQLKEHYHSIHGAVQESMHVFIRMGLGELTPGDIAVLEIGFGTGLNMLLTLLHGRNFRSIGYHAVENDPLEWELVQLLKYEEYLSLPPETGEVFRKIHLADWNSTQKLSENFVLHKIGIDLTDYLPGSNFDLIYFDAFAPAVQPELWEEDVFIKLYRALHPGGILVTYCAKGEVRRKLQDIGYNVERLPGPPGKREMLRAKHPDR